MQEGAMATTPVGDTSNALDPRGMHPVVTNLWQLVAISGN
jgi:hypothetical protein